MSQRSEFRARETKVAFIFPSVGGVLDEGWEVEGSVEGFAVADLGEDPSAEETAECSFWDGTSAAGAEASDAPSAIPEATCSGARIFSLPEFPPAFAFAALALFFQSVKSFPVGNVGLGIEEEDMKYSIITPCSMVSRRFDAR